MRKIKLTVATFNQNLFSGDVDSFTCMGAAGEMTVLANHEPLITTLKESDVIIRGAEESTDPISIKGGILEISANQATILV